MWKNLHLKEPWWIGIETIFENRIILHGYTKPDMPEHKGIWALDLDTGKIVWQNESMTFWFHRKKCLYAYQYFFDRRVGYELNIEDGSIIAEHNDNLNNLNEIRNQYEEDFQQGVLFPSLADKISETPYYNEIKGDLFSEILEGWIEYLVRKDILILSYYQKKISQNRVFLDNLLVIYDLKGKKQIYKDYIIKDVITPNSDTFFVKDEILIFIQNQKTVVALKPWK